MSVRFRLGFAGRELCARRYHIILRGNLLRENLQGPVIDELHKPLRHPYSDRCELVDLYIILRESERLTQQFTTRNFPVQVQSSTSQHQAIPAEYSYLLQLPSEKERSQKIIKNHKKSH